MCNVMVHCGEEGRIMQLSRAHLALLLPVVREFHIIVHQVAAILAGHPRLMRLPCCVLTNSAQTLTAAYQPAQPFLAVLWVDLRCLDLPVMFALRLVALLMNVVVGIAPVLFAPLQAMC
jgi:hypothetical protein